MLGYDNVPAEKLLKHIRSDDTIVVHAALKYLQGQLAKPLPDARRNELLGVVPTTLNGLTLECQLLVVQLYRHLPVDKPLPSLDVADKPSSIVVEWVITQLLRNPKAVVDDQHMLSIAFANLDWQQVSEPEALFDRIAASDKTQLQLLLIEKVGDSVLAGTITPESGQQFLLNTLSAKSSMVVTAGLRRLTLPCLLALDCPTAELNRLIDQDQPTEVSLAALRTLAMWPCRELLLQRAENETRPQFQAHIAMHLASWAENEDVDLILDAALSGRLYGVLLRDAIRFESIGTKITRRDMPKVFEVSLMASDISPRVFARLIGPHWEYWLQRLESLPSDDPNWAHQIQIVSRFPKYCSLGAKHRSKPNWLGDRVFEFLLGLLCDPKFSEHFALLAEQISRLPRTSEQRQAVEGRLVELLSDIPDAVFEGLRRVGGDAAVQIMLKASIGESRTPIPVQQANEWLLSTGNADEAEFLGNPQDWTPSLLKHFHRVAAPSIIGQLCQIAQTPNHAARIAAIEQLSQIGDQHAVKPLGRLLHEDDEEIRELASVAIRQIGARLHEHHQIRPACLIDARNRNEAGEFVLADTLLDLIDEAATPDDLKHLLSQLAGLRHPQLPMRLVHLRAHKDQHVVKLVIESAVKPLEAMWLHGYVIGDNHFLARQAIIALGKHGSLCARWASGALVQALDHPNMNVKKSAAVALQTAGKRMAVPSIIQWLRTHDNPGLRSELSQALDAIIGEQQKRCFILTQLPEANAREIDLLLDVLDRQIPLQTIVVHLKRCQEQDSGIADWLEILIEQVIDGKHYLQDASAAELKQTLVQQGLLSGSFASKFDSLEHSESQARKSPPLNAVSGLHDLRLNLDEALQDLASSESQRRNRAFELFERHVAQMHVSERAALAEALRKAMQHEGLPIDRTLALFRECDAVVTDQVASVAWRLANDPKKTPGHQREWAFHATRFSSLQKAITHKQVVWLIRTLKSDQSELIQFAIEQGWQNELLADAPNWSRVSVVCLRKHWQGDPPTANQLIEAIQKSPDVKYDTKAELFGWLAGLREPAVDQWMLSQIGKRQAIDLRSYFRTHWSSKAAPRVLELLDAKQPATRIAAAEILIDASNQYRKPVLQSYIDGKLGQEPPFRPAVNELRDWPAFNADVDDRRLRLLAQSNGSIETKIDLALVFHNQLSDRSEEADVNVRKRLQSITRSFPLQSLLPAIASPIENRKWSYLELLGQTRFVPSRVVDWVRTADDEGVENWLDVLERWAVSGPIGGEGLAEVLLRIASSADQTTADDRVHQANLYRCIVICGGLQSWADRSGAANLLDELTKFLQCDDDRCRAAEVAILSGIQTVSTQAQVQLLTSIDGLEDRQAFVECFTDLYLQRPAILESALPSLRTKVRGMLIEMATGRDPERARLALRRLVEDHDEDSTEILVHALGHPQSTVRSFAHRLLRRTASKEDYLEATLVLLDDRVPEFRKSAIRVLSFGKYEPAIKKIVPLLHDRKKQVDRAAKEGLNLFGDAAINALRQALNRTRPDRRQTLQDVIDLIESDLA